MGRYPFHEIGKVMKLKEPSDKTMILRTLWKVQAFFNLKIHLKRRLEAKELELSENDLIELVIRKLYKL
jgi:hypothetical protein